MFASTAPQVLHRSRALESFALAIIAVVLTVVAWALLAARPTGTDSAFPALPARDVERIRSVAYTVPDGAIDRLYIRTLDGEGDPRLIASLPFALDARARGSASPMGDHVAVIWVPTTAAAARLSLFSMPDGERTDVEGSYDYLTTFAWAPDGSRLAIVGYGPSDASGRVTATVVAVDVPGGEAKAVATFESVFVAAPVGYGLDGRLFVVTIDQRGSVLWVVRDGEVAQVAPLSSGRTRDWRLSPDGSRLAYVEVVGGAEQRRYVGRVVLTATGRVTPAGNAGDHFGVAWIPGTEVPVFGGPGGTLRLWGAESPHAYVVPFDWSPDGTTLAAAVYAFVSEDEVTLEPSIELVTPERRTRLADEPGARFLGWVLNPEPGGAGEE